MMRQSSICISVIVILLSAVIEAWAQKKISLSVYDKLTPLESCRIDGYIGQRLDGVYDNRILTTDVDHLIEPFRHRNETRCWQSEFWGKWFTSAVLAYRYRPEERLREILRSAAEDIIATQTGDGYIGNYKEGSHLKQWDIWGRKYTLLGLLDYYDLTKDGASIRAAQKLADHLIKEIAAQGGSIVDKGNYRGMAASSVLEPMVRLYNVTGKRTYLDFAREIVRQWETPGGPQLISKSVVNVSQRFPKPANWYSWEQGQKAYEMMSCYEGLLELYRVTGEPEYMRAVENTWQNIRDREINIAGSGAAAEMWFDGRERQTSPVHHYQETCVTVTWIKLNQQLLRLTGEAKYADEIERAYYNALLAALKGDGSDWAKYTPLSGQRLPGSGQCGMDLNCCDASGARGLFTLPASVVMSAADGLSVNFFVNGSYRLKTPGGKEVTVTETTVYPSSGTIKITLGLQAPEEMSMRLRIPSWSARNTLKINEEDVDGVEAGRFAELRRVWRDGDEVTLTLDMRGRVEWAGDINRYAAIVRGPVVLARDTRLSGPHLATANKPVTDDNGYIELSPVDKKTSGVWMEYTASFIPESYTETPAGPISITLCDYASAGNGEEPSTFQTWMPQIYNPRDGD